MLVDVCRSWLDLYRMLADFCYFFLQHFCGCLLDLGLIFYLMFVDFCWICCRILVGVCWT